MDKKDIAESKMSIEEIIAKFEKPPLSMRPCKPVEPADCYVGVVIDSAFVFNGAHHSLVQFLNYMADAGYRLFLNRDTGYAVSFLVFEKVDK